MTTPNEEDRAAAHALAASEDLCDWWSGEEDHSSPCIRMLGEGMKYLEHREMTPAEIRLEWELHAPQSAATMRQLSAVMEAETWYGTSDPWAVGWRMWWATQGSRR